MTVHDRHGMPLSVGDLVSVADTVDWTSDVNGQRLPGMNLATVDEIDEKACLLTCTSLWFRAGALTCDPGDVYRKVWRTADGVDVTVGLRVITNEWKWGTVVEIGTGTDICNGEAWHAVRYDDDPADTPARQCKRFDGGRLATREPSPW